MARVTLGVVFLLAGCTPLVTEQRAATLDTEIRAIHRDFAALSTTFTPEQRAKYAQAQAGQDEATFQAFYAALDAQQRATMNELLSRAQQVEQERQRIVHQVQQDLAMRCWARRNLPNIVMVPPVGGI